MSAADASERPRRYVVETADRAAAEREDAFLRLLRLVGPEYANAWYNDLCRAIDGLPDFPGPLSHVVDEEASALFGVEVRRMLYYGPGRRGSGTPYRVLFTVIPPAEGEDESIIRVLRILHGARQPLGEIGTESSQATGDAQA